MTFDGEVECQTEMATYILFTVHTDDDDDDDDDTTTLFNLLYYRHEEQYKKDFKSSSGSLEDRKSFSFVELSYSFSTYT